MACVGRIKIVGVNGEIVEEVTYNEEIRDVQHLREILAPYIKTLKALRGKVNVSVIKGDGTPLTDRDFPYCGDLELRIVTSGA